MEVLSGCVGRDVVSGEGATVTSLLGAMLDAPLIAVSKRHPYMLHAVDGGEVAGAWPDGTVTAPCGRSGLRLLADGERVLPWPPRAKGLSPEHERCRECWVSTGSKRPRSQMKAR